MSATKVQPDVTESAVRTAENVTQQSTGLSLLHLATVASIGASIVLYALGKKQLAIFIGLWPPTLQALKSAITK